MSLLSIPNLSVQNLSAGYKGKPVIHDVCVEATPGQLIALIGPNGSGKSTLIKSLAGLLPVRAGDIWIGDDLLTMMEPRDRARNLAYLAQDRIASDFLKVDDILELGRAPFRGRLGQISAAGRSAIARAIQATDLEPYRTRRFGELSGGEQARVLLARALVVDAPILLADEPNAALDPYYQQSTMNILRAEAARGKTVIAALHDLQLAARFSDQIWVMNEGEIAARGPAGRVFKSDIVETVFRVPADQFEYD